MERSGREMLPDSLTPLRRTRAEIRQLTEVGSPFPDLSSMERANLVNWLTTPVFANRKPVLT